MVDITVLIPTKNEDKNIGFCLEPLVDWAQEVVIIDSRSTDKTLEIAAKFGAKAVTFDYKGGWPKKRQYVIETYDFKTSWILLLDADEILTERSKQAIEKAIQSTEFNGYYLWFRLEFMGRMLLKSDPGLRKLSLFKRGLGYFEKRFEDQDQSMGDMEVHEHVVLKSGTVGEIIEPIIHRNYNNISRFIIKHDEYSNYEAKVHTAGLQSEIKEKFFGTKEERRRFLKKKLIRNPLSPFLFFIYLYFFRLGFLEGRSGFYYILYQCIYLYFVQTKIYEIENP
jgi:glycosyltransferase involved in cell wall biosynthesis